MPARPEPLCDDAFSAVTERPDDFIALDEALQRLSTLNERHARVVECRFYGGMSVEETADVLGISPATVKREWALAKGWLYRELAGRRGDSGPT